MDRLTIDELAGLLCNPLIGQHKIVPIISQCMNTMRENERLRNAIGNLSPLRDFDWHGKWRIVGCLDALEQSNKDSEHG